jgi:hypothetical protein
MGFTLFSVAMAQMPETAIHWARVWDLFVLLSRVSKWILIFFALLPLAMTMALLWKTKEVILDSVFGTHT